MLESFARIVVVTGALALPACSDEPKSESAVAGAAGAMSIAAAGGGGSSGGGAGSGGAAGTSMAGASGAPAMPCSSYADESPWSLVVHISNEMKETLYLGQDTMTCEIERLFQVADGARTALPALEGCRTSCDALMQSGPATCPTVCAAPVTIALEPGQSLDVPWDGRFGVEHSLPASCASAGAGASLQCVQARRVEPSVYTFSARAGTRRQCLDASGACTCTPSATGGCTSPSSLIAGTIITTELLLKLEPGEPATSGEPPFIGLAFREP